MRRAFMLSAGAVFSQSYLYKKMKGYLLPGIILFVLFFSACNSDSESPLDEEEAMADSCDLRGFNWADARDNFVDGWIIPSGLTSSDTYDEVQEKAGVIFSEWKNVGANTVRLPINPSSVSESWWSAYKGAIDAATNMGMNVILCCWESESSEDGAVDDLTAFWEMWQSVVDNYEDNSKVYFEVFNEPYGYSTSDLVELYNKWLNNYSSIPHKRVILGGTGYSENVSKLGAYFEDCLFSQHIYAWWGSYTSIADWETDLAGRIGNYGDRTVITEFGATMSTGKDYTGASNGDTEKSFIKGVTEYCRNNGISNIYWPGLRDDDSYSLYSYDGSMVLVNSSGLERIQYGWVDQRIY